MRRAGRAHARGGGGGRWGATVPASLGSFRFPGSAQRAALRCLLFCGSGSREGWLRLVGAGWARHFGSRRRISNPSISLMKAKEAPERLKVAEVENLVHLLEFGACP